jgi:hypothetical protein
LEGKTRPRSLIVTVSALVLAIGAIGVGVAGAQATGDSYTGCLKGGTLTKVAIGSEPLSPCPPSATEISWNETGQQGPPGSSVCSTGSPMSLSGGTNDTLVPDNDNTFGSLIQQLAATTTNTNGLASIECFGTLSDFSVTASGNPDGTLSEDPYVFILRHNGGMTSVQCTIDEGTGAPWTCTDTADPTSLEVLPGDTVNVRVFKPFGDAVPLHFDWSATFTYSMPTAPISPIA